MQRNSKSSYKTILHNHEKIKFTSMKTLKTITMRVDENIKILELSTTEYEMLKAILTNVDPERPILMEYAKLLYNDIYKNHAK